MHPTRLGRCPLETAGAEQRASTSSKWDYFAWETRRRGFDRRRTLKGSKERRLAECAAVAAEQRVAEEVASTSDYDPLLPQEGSFSGVRPRVVVLGSGWGAVGFIKALTKETCSKYDIVLISPRNYFLYTPLLPAIATGTLEERSIVEPIRNIISGKGRYMEAKCTSIDPKSKTIVACSPSEDGDADECFRIPYDMLVVAVGAVTSTFGVEGVADNCFFFKTVEDAHRLRVHLTECFEKAALPKTTQEEREKLLSFVIVGGGPTGVEVAAELHDMLKEDLAKLYPDLIQSVSLKIIDNADHVLKAFHPKLSDYAQEEFLRDGIDLALNTRVLKVEPGVLTISVSNGNGAGPTRMPFGTCVWATGIAKNPLVTMMQEVLPGQNHFRSILTDGHLRVKGSTGSIWSIGDASTIEQPRAQERANELFERADKGKDGMLSLDELKGILKEMKEEFPQFEKFARFSVITGLWRHIAQCCEKGEFQPNDNLRDSLAKSAYPEAENIVSSFTSNNGLSKEEFVGLLKMIDTNVKTLPATAQVARQQGEYLAKLFNSKDMHPGTEFDGKVQPFRYHHKGQLAYVGEDKAVIDIPKLGLLFGVIAGLIWKSFETYSQVSLRSQCLVGLDWVRTKVFGRDISRV